jgi:hypothetical protein
MKRLLIGALAATVVAPLAVAKATEPASTQLRVAVCHKQASAARPYVKIVVRTRAALRRHQRHAADIIPAPRGACPRTVLTPTRGGVAITAELFGITERPAPGDPDATGRATIRLRRGQGQVCYRIDVDEISLPATGAHIHRGDLNVDGPVVLALRAPNPAGTVLACARASRTLVRQILANRAGYYVNVHTSDFPGGAARAQLGPTEGVHFFVANLSGTAEIPSADPSTEGTARVRIREGQRAVCFTIVVRRLDLPATGAHIHRGTDQQNGPVVVPFTAPAASGTSRGCVTADSQALVNEILANPGGFYVNVHNGRFPNGAARAQLRELDIG